MALDDIPTFNPLSEEEIADLKATLGVVDVDESQPAPINEVRPKRRGRPPGSKNKSTVAREGGLLSDDPGITLSPAPLTKREEREVATRLGNIFMGATGMGGMVKPYIPMTEEEAKAIAEPLASYLIRNEPTNGIAREILENYDLLAMTLGVGAYSVRVYRDRREELATERPKNTTATQRISDLPPSTNGREPHEGISTLVSVPNVTRSGSTPFDL